MKRQSVFPGLHLFLFFALIGLSPGCSPPVEEQGAAPATAIDPALDFRPNILWLVAEDLSPYLPAFGDSTVATPHLSQLAAQGVCYDHFFSPAPVCAPARAAIITGMYPTHIGANHMRTGPWYAPEVSPEALAAAARNMPEGVIPYEVVPPPGVKMMSEHLRAAGYYCTNNAKEDYQFRKAVTAWDESSREAHWRRRAPGQPFFAVFNFEVTHESRIWSKAGDSLWVDADLDVPVPPYLPDTEVGRQDIRRLYSNVKEMDFQVGKVLQQLEEDGLLEKTVIFWYTDHGGPLPRQKRLLYDAGIHAPLIIRFPGQPFAGQRSDQLISFIDLAPTVLSLAGIKPPAHLDGRAFLGPYRAAEERPYIFAAADRFDSSYDAIRAARDKRFKYLKYYAPEKPFFLPIPYRDQMPIMQELYRLRAADALTDVQAQWFRTSKPREELFDVSADPHEINNLADDPAYAEKLKELRTACRQWVAVMNDRNLQPEPELIRQFWPEMKQPTTEQPVLHREDGLLRITCATPGASIGYRLLAPDQDQPEQGWNVYTGPLAVSPGQEAAALAHRIGYRPSAVVRLGGNDTGGRQMQSTGGEDR